MVQIKATKRKKYRHAGVLFKICGWAFSKGGKGAAATFKVGLDKVQEKGICLRWGKGHYHRTFLAGFGTRNESVRAPMSKEGRQNWGGLQVAFHRGGLIFVVVG